MKLKNYSNIAIESLGGSDTVTGSCTLLRLENDIFLVDAGLFQGEDEFLHRNSEYRMDSANKVKAIFLTHAHLDHCGYLPRLAFEGFSGPIFCTPPTRDLAELVMMDAASIFQEEARKENKGVLKKRLLKKPLYRTQDVQRVLNLMKVVDFNKTEVFNDLRFTFYPAGHIPGAASLSVNPVNYPRCKALFSGDLGREDDPLIRPPEIEGEHNVIIMESTYGNRIHASKDGEGGFHKLMVQLISKIKKRKSVLLIPAFSIARSQMVLFLLMELMKKDTSLEVPIYMDSPMGLRANRLFLKHHKELKISKAHTEKLFDYHMSIKESWDEESRQKKELQGAQILISSSGMMTGGKVLEHFKNLSLNSDNIIYFPGYLGKGTLGRKVVDKEVHCLSEVYQAQDLSSHADREQLLSWLKKAVGSSVDNQGDGIEVYLNHGDDEAREALKESIQRELGFTAQLLLFKS